MQTPRTFLVAWLVSAGSSLATTPPALDGKVVELDGSGKAGVTVTLQGAGRSTLTASDGTWTISGPASAMPSRPGSNSIGQGGFSLTSRRLSPQVRGVDPSGRRIGSEEANDYPVRPAAFRAMSAPDTLVYSLGGRVFLRDTTYTWYRSGIVRRFDTTVNATITHGYLTDARDGHVYRTVRIGTQVWMAQNLEWVVDSSWIPSGDPDSGAAYGRLYNWPTAMGLDPTHLSTPPNATDQPTRGICPTGWHLPSRAEWAVLDTFASLPSTIPLSGRYLRSRDGWVISLIRSPLTDTFGFKGMPAGHRDTSGIFREFHTEAGWWSSSDSTEAAAWERMNYTDYSSGGGSYRLWEEQRSKQVGMPVRCLQD